MRIRAPYPAKPRLEIGKALREALVCAWYQLDLDVASAYDELEFALIAAIADVEAVNVQQWERIYGELRRARLRPMDSQPI